MATTPKTVQHPQHAAFPSLFKRTGEARRVKGHRASRETFNRAMRTAKVLDLAHRLTIFTPVGAMVLSASATELLKQDGAIAALILNGYLIIPSRVELKSDDVDTFLHEHNMLKGEDLVTGNMFEDVEE